MVQPIILLVKLKMGTFSPSYAKIHPWQRQGTLLYNHNNLIIKLRRMNFALLKWTNQPKYYLFLSIIRCNLYIICLLQLLIKGFFPNCEPIRDWILFTQLQFVGLFNNFGNLQCYHKIIWYFDPKIYKHTSENSQKFQVS